MITSALAARKAALAAKVSKMVGTAVEITYRDEQNITLSAAGNHLETFKMAGVMHFPFCGFEADYDVECEMTFAFIALPSLAKVNAVISSLKAL